MRPLHGVTLVLLLAFPTVVSAQQLPEPKIDVGSSIEGYLEPVDINYSELNIIRCIDPTAVNNGFIATNCFGNPMDEDQTREEANAVSRWVRAGMLFVGSLYATVETIKGIFDTFQMTVNAVKAIIHAFDFKSPEMTVYRMTWASDMAVQRLQAASHVFAYYQTPVYENDRFARVQTLVVRALALAADADETAIHTSDAATGMTLRITDTGSIMFYDVSGRKTDRSSVALPPLPSDAPAGANPLYAGARTAPSRVASMIAEATGPARAAGSATESNEPVCALDGDDGEPPAVMFDRVATMAKGAQTSAIAVSSDLRENRDLIKLVQLRERQHDLEKAMGRLLTSLTLF